MRRYWHYTSAVHLPRILADGVLRRTESNLDPVRGHAGPDVVWLLDGPELGGAPHGLAGSSADKTAVRFEVELDERRVKPWLAWAAAQGIDPGWRDSLVRVGGGPEAAARWMISFGRIPRERWVRVEDLKKGAIVWERPDWIGDPSLSAEEKEARFRALGPLPTRGPRDKDKDE